MSREIRNLIENYYDIQKLRIETGNRLVCWVKENRSKLIEAFSQLITETQFKCASHIKLETHVANASHIENESQFKLAIDLLQNKKYAEFTKRFILSHSRCETQKRSASQVEDETHSFFALFREIENLRWFHLRLYETEKELYRRIDLWSRDHELRKKFLNYVKGIGPILSSGIIAWLCSPREFLINQVIKIDGRRIIHKQKNKKRVFNLGEKGEIVEYNPEEKWVKVRLPSVIECSDYVSQLWSYCGLKPGSERRKGERLQYNPRLKTFCWKIGQSFIKFKCFGRKLYDAFKEDCQRKHKDWTKLHIHNYARRKVVKLFLASVWEAYRRIRGLEVTKPYPIEVLGHKQVITFDKWMEKGEGR